MPDLIDPWIEKLQSSHTSFESNIEELCLFLKKSLYTSLGSKPEVTPTFIEDIVQISIVKILDNLDSFNGLSKFTTWCLTITMRSAYTELRKKHWNNLSLDDQLNPPLPTEPFSEITPSKKAIENDLYKELHSAIHSSLSNRQRELLFMKLKGMPQSEIAKKLNISANTLYKNFHDIRKKLNTELTKQGYTKNIVIEILNSATS